MVGHHQRAAGLRRTIGLILVAGLCVSAVTFYRDAELPRSAPSVASTTPSVTVTSSPPTPPTTSPKATPSPTPTQAKLPKGPGTTRPGILLMASPLPDGSFDIAEIVLLTTPTLSIQLGPPILTQAGGRFAKAKPVVSQLQVSAGNQPVMVPRGRIHQPTEVALHAPAKRIELRYILSGVSVRSVPSTAGRALTAISPLVAGVPRDLPVAMMVSGSTVLNIECPVLPLRDRACAMGRPPTLRVKEDLRWNSAVIVVQFDLPRPQ